MMTAEPCDALLSRTGNGPALSGGAGVSSGSLQFPRPAIVGGEPAEALLEHAQATLAAGRLAASREQFRAAAAAAARVGDFVTYAEAAIGAGGLWLYEVRVADERVAYLDLVQQALARLGSERMDMQLRFAPGSRRKRPTTGAARSMRCMRP